MKYFTMYILYAKFVFLDHHKSEKNHSPSSIHANSSKLGSIPAAPSSLTSVAANSVNVVHMSVRKTQSDPPDQLPPGRSMLSEQPIPPPPGPKNNFRPGGEQPPMLMPRNPTTSVVVIEHTTKMAVNNNVGEENNGQIQDNGKNSNSSSNEKQIQSHIFV